MALPAEAAPLLVSFDNDFSTGGQPDVDKDEIARIDDLDNNGTMDFIEVYTSFGSSPTGESIDALSAVSSAEWIASLNDDIGGGIDNGDLFFIDDTSGSRVITKLLESEDVSPGGKGIDAVHLFSDNMLIVSIDGDDPDFGDDFLGSPLDVESWDLILLTFTGDLTSEITITDAEFFIDVEDGDVGGADIKGFTIDEESGAYLFTSSGFGSIEKQDIGQFFVTGINVTGTAKYWDNPWTSDQIEAISNVGVPEPATLAMLGLGALGAVGLRHRRVRGRR